MKSEIGQKEMKSTRTYNTYMCFSLAYFKEKEVGGWEREREETQEKARKERGE